MSVTLAVCLAASLAITAVVHRWVDTRLRRRRFAASHGCRPLRRVWTLDPILGLDLLVRIVKAVAGQRSLEFWHTEMFAKHGNTMESNLAGDDIILTNDERNIQAVLATRFHDFEIGERRRALSRDFIGVGFFNADGKTWEHARALARPNFARKQVKLELFEKHLQVWYRSLPPEGTPFDWQVWAFRFTMDVSAEFFFGASPGVLKPEATELSKEFAWAFDHGTNSIAHRIKLGKLAWLYRNRDDRKAGRIVQTYVDSLIADTVSLEKGRPLQKSQRPDESEHYFFLQAMVDDGMAMEDIRGQMLSIFLASRDTTAGVMSAAMWQISRQPAMAARLRREIAEKLGHRHPTHEDLKELTYMSWFIKETLRLYPPVPVNMRRAARDTWLPRGGGPDGSSPVFVKGGQEVFYSVWSLHRRPDIWGADAGDFRPERWEKARPHFEFLPFNGGPRICLGQQFAITEVTYVLVRFLQEFAHIGGIGTERPWTEKLTLTCSLAQGVNIQLKRRSSGLES